MKYQNYVLGGLIVFGVLFSCKVEKPIVEYEFNDEQKDATTYTTEKQEAIEKHLNFDPDNITKSNDYIAATKGNIDTISVDYIPDAANAVYNTKEYDFLKKEDAAPTSNPSLWRQSRLNRINGLFEVVEGEIYQVRGFDLANMTLIKGETGWIVVDPLSSPETAKAGLDLANEKFGRRDVSAVIFTHSHLDHFGGIKGVMQNFGRKAVPIYAPKGFFDEAVSENVMAGNTMGRRASYMYGNILDKNQKGTLGTGLGQTTSTGMAGIMIETHIIDFDVKEEIDVDGLGINFIYTPEAEAPAEMMFYIPDHKAFCQAEEINHTLHNLYTLRGAKVRNGQKWSQYIDQVIQKWGDEVLYSFGSHHWPTWNEARGGNKIKKYWENQRDLYRFIHDQTLRLANKGYTPIEIADTLQLPTAIDTVFANRGYYGTVSHNARAQYQLYFGWFDGNPANLNKLPPTEAGENYVEFMGGIDRILRKSVDKFNAGEYRFVAEVLNHVVFAKEAFTTQEEKASYKKAKYLLADTYEQLGYQSESGPWRNFYLSGAKELRAIRKPGAGEASLVTASPDMVSGMSNELLFNYIAMRFNGLNENAQTISSNFQIIFENQGRTSDEVDDKHVALIVKNGVVTPRIGYDLKSSEITEIIKLTREDLNNLIIQDRESGNITTIDDIITITAVNGTIIEYNNSKFKEFVANLDPFDFWFNIVTP